MSDDGKSKAESAKQIKIDKAVQKQIEQIIKNRSLLAAGLGLMPVPGLNLISTTAIQISMVQSITKLYEKTLRDNELYDVKMDKYWIKNIITSVLGGLAGAGGSGVLARGLLSVPLAGVSLAALTGPALHGITTYAIGYMFIRYFESPKGFVKTNTEAFTVWFKDGIKEAREKLGSAIAGKQKTATS